MKSPVRLMIAAIAAIALGLVASAAAHPDSQYGIGPGMMGGDGPGYGMGHGMMGHHGPGYGMGMGMWGWSNYAGLDLTSDQRSKIARIQQDVRTKHWSLMGKMMDARYRLQDLYEADKPDRSAINEQYKQMEDLRRQMVDLSIDARNEIEAVLTKEQREKFGDGRRGRGHMMWGW